MERFSRIFVGIVLALVALVALPTVATAKTAPKGKQIHGIYNQQYCELFSLTSFGPPIQVDVYNTTGLSECPTDQFEALDLNQAQTELGTIKVLKNGPRHWVIDGITGAKAGPTINIAGMDFHLVGVLEPPSLGPPPFTEIKIHRTTTWNYRKGRTMRIVVSPTGTKYAMQAYTNVVDASITEKSLNTLDSNPAIALPEGWKFKTRKLKHKVTLSAKGTAHIVRDGVGSVYQRFTWPKPKPKHKK